MPEWHTPSKLSAGQLPWKVVNPAAMWPWTRREPAKDSLRTRVADLEADHLRIRAEWKDVSDRLLRMDERQRKRAERAEPHEPPQDTPAARKAALRLRLMAQRGTGA